MIRTAKTENGWVRGIPAADPRITSFKGIPFAAPPVGPNRWRAPQPCENWEGVRDAFCFAPISVQDVPGLSDNIYTREWHVDPEIPMDEDCLYLNVWTGAKSDTDKHPVLVWFYGGALQWGYPSEMEFDGERLARRGVVVVTVNYRINVFGFMAHPQITGAQTDAPANFGSLDQQAGLKWVIQNIRAFGGDPENITIAGQSAGGGSVLSQMACPENFGLFQRAVVMSGMIRSPYEKGHMGIPKPLAEAEKNGEEFLSYLGVSTIEEARELDALYIRDKYAEYASDHPRMGTVVDGSFCVGDPLKLFLEGKCADGPVMAGNTRDEFPSFLSADSRQELEEKARSIFGIHSGRFLELLEEEEGGRYGKVSGLECTIKGIFGRKKQSGCRQNLYYYKFMPDIPGWDDPGCFHSVDLWFFFETLAKCWRPFVGRHYDLARQMCNYFANFIKSGDPNGQDADEAPMPAWLPYTDREPSEMDFTTNGAVTVKGKERELIRFLGDCVVRGLEEGGRKQAFNPYLPSWEYVPDGEPYVFGDRVYIYGSHDLYNGHVFCLGDYVCWSAPVDDLGDWRYEGVIYPKTSDPINRDGKMCLYAPDVTVGPDGRYYLYYVLDHVSVVSVAVCDTPAGRYEFYGYVHYEDGTRLGEKAGDQPQFDPGLLTEGERTYLYTGFCGRGDKSRSGAMATVLGPDMLTIVEPPVFVAPGCEYSEGTGFEGHEFFEAPSMRKIGDTYYLIYSSIVMHELCYAVSKEPTRGFVYGGVLVSNCDLHIDTYKPASQPMAYGANNHGSIVEIAGEWYIFYHRHTNGTWYSRQACAERLTVLPDGRIPQVEITSCGLNGGPLTGSGEYPAYIACHLFTNEPSVYVGGDSFPRVMQDGRDGDEEPGYIANIQDSATAGFKYFDCRGVKEIRIKTRGYGDGVFEVKTSWDGEALAKIRLKYTDVWEEYGAPVAIPDGVQSIYLTYRGGGKVSLLSFTLL